MNTKYLTKMYREWKKNRIPKKVLHMHLETRLRGRPRNRWQDEVWEDGTLVDGKGWKERGMEAAHENGKESLHSAHANEINE
jgi:hypothetical protein